MNKIDLTGQRFGRLTVIEEGPRGNPTKGRPKGVRRWWCLCTCGKEKLIAQLHIKHKRILSCGCYNREQAAKRKITHGMRKTKIYDVWSTMKARCSRPSHISYKNYKDYKVCSSWEKFENFFKDMGATYKEGLWIERINTKGNYEPTNCCWATPTQQNRNRTNNVSYMGKCVTEWAEQVGINSKTLYERLKRGWSWEKALNTPVRKRKSNGH